METLYHLARDMSRFGSVLRECLIGSNGGEGGGVGLLGTYDAAKSDVVEASSVLMEDIDILCFLEVA